MTETTSQMPLPPTGVWGPPCKSLLTPELLDEKLQVLLLQLTHNISQEVGKIPQELREEIDQIGERTDMLETKFYDMIQYVHAQEEENSSLKHSQLQLHQEDMENRERHQNLNIRGVPETVVDNKLCDYLLGLFNFLAPDILILLI